MPTRHRPHHPDQVDVCQLGSLGPKAIIGDIPALLGGVQPASIVAKTPLRVLQCRADRFASHLDHNVRAKTGEPLLTCSFKNQINVSAEYTDKVHNAQYKASEPRVLCGLEASTL